MSIKIYQFYGQKLARLKLAEHYKVDPNMIRLLLTKEAHQSGLEYKGKTYNVRIASPGLVARKQHQLFWDFDLRDDIWEEGKVRKQQRETKLWDYFLLIALVNDEPKQYYLIPEKKAPKSHIRISVAGQSKYDIYAI